MAIKVVGIVGSYRKGKTIDSAVSAILEGGKGHKVALLRAGCRQRRFTVIRESVAQSSQSRGRTRPAGPG